MRLQGTMRINEQGRLEIGGCDTVDLAGEFGTPLYIMDEELFRQNCRNYYHAFTERYNGDVAYAGKAFLTMAVCRMVEEEGLSLDVVSGGELYTALTAGFPAERIYFHGNNKTDRELVMALEAGVGRFMLDNFYELEKLDRLASVRGMRPEVLLRLTPGLEAHTHEYIRTGQVDSKFGFTLPNGQALQAVKRVLASNSLVLKGVHCHIGSQIFELEAYVQAAYLMVDFLAEVYKESGVILGELDLGGGLGIYYVEGDTPRQVEEYADLMVGAVRERSREHGLPEPRVAVEPGRSIVGPTGTTLYTVGSVKEIPGVRKYVAVDGGMADNIRPALYRARYEAVLANRSEEGCSEVVSVTGKCCESGDMLIWDISLPPVVPGDLLAVSCTGAYGYAMSSNYNRLGRPAAILASHGRADLILQREDYADLIRNDLLPARLSK